MSENTKKDYYSILGVSPSATEEEILAAYRKLVLEWHPDRWVNGTEKEKKYAEERTKVINEARDAIFEQKKKDQEDKQKSQNKSQEPTSGTGSSGGSTGGTGPGKTSSGSNTGGTGTRRTSSYNSTGGTGPGKTSSQSKTDGPGKKRTTSGSDPRHSGNEKSKTSDAGGSKPKGKSGNTGSDDGVYWILGVLAAILLIVLLLWAASRKKDESPVGPGPDIPVEVMDETPEPQPAPQIIIDHTKEINDLRSRIEAQLKALQTQKDRNGQLNPELIQSVRNNINRLRQLDRESSEKYLNRINSIVDG